MDVFRSPLNTRIGEIGEIDICICMSVGFLSNTIVMVILLLFFKYHFTYILSVNVILYQVFYNSDVWAGKNIIYRKLVNQPIMGKGLSQNNHTSTHFCSSE